MPIDIENIKTKGRVQLAGGGFLVLIENLATAIDNIRDRDLLAEMSTLAEQAFGQKLNEENSEDAYSQIVVADTLTIFGEQQEIIGWAATRFLVDEQLLFLHGIVVRPRTQYRGIGQLLLQRHLAHWKTAKTIALTTQNPRMYGLLKKSCRQVFPSPAAPTLPEHLHSTVQKALTQIHVEDCSPTAVLTGFYSKCLYPEIPESADQTINEWFKRGLAIEDRQSKNGILLIGVI
jgi:hypothetical protein